MTTDPVGTGSPDGTAWSGWAPPPGAQPGLPPPPAKRSRRGLYIVLGIFAALGLVGIGLAVIVDKTVLRHDLVTTDFTTSAEPFHVGTNAGYRFSLERNTYRIQARTSLEDNPGPAWSFGEFTRIAYTADTSVRVAEITDPSTDGVSVGCAETAPSASEQAQSLFMLIAIRGGVAIMHVNGAVTDKAAFEKDWLIDKSWREVKPGDQLTLRCSHKPMTKDHLDFEAWINGKKVLSTSHKARYGDDGFSAMVVGFATEFPGNAARFDDAVATVPE